MSELNMPLQSQSKQADKSKGGDRESNSENSTRTRARTPLIPDEMRTKAIESLAGGMDATRRYWDKEDQKWIEEPDWPTRTKSAELVLAYSDGRPVEMRVELTGGFESFNEKLSKLCSTPEGLKMAIQSGIIGVATPENEKKPKVLEAKPLRSLNKDENEPKSVPQQ